MKTLLHKAWRLLRDEDGPTAVEYAVMLAFIILVCFAAITSVGTTTNGLMKQVVDKGGFS